MFWIFARQLTFWKWQHVILLLSFFVLNTIEQSMCWTSKWMWVLCLQYSFIKVRGFEVTRITKYMLMNMNIFTYFIIFTGRVVFLLICYNFSKNYKYSYKQVFSIWNTSLFNITCSIRYYNLNLKWLYRNQLQILWFEMYFNLPF